jgi:hypothetical protein
VRAQTRARRRRAQAAERAKVLERLSRWKGPQLQQLLELFDLPTPSAGTKVWCVVWCGLC